MLDERRVGSELQFLVEWEGQETATGDDYEPTWVSKLLYEHAVNADHVYLDRLWLATLLKI